MQAIMEGLFDAVYLVSVVSIGFLMYKKSGGRRQYKMFGLMAIVLGLGDSFHLVPRVYALFTTGLRENAAILGFGKLVTSITMTVFYVILFLIWRERYKISGMRGISYSVYGLAALRIALCLFPQNDWFNYDAPLSWGIYRNIPFAALGIVIIFIFYNEAKRNGDKAFKYMWLAITLSFALYAPVVLWADTYPIVGMLMIPKTLAYVWVVLMGYFEFRRSNRLKVV